MTHIAADERLISASFGNRDQLRAFIADRYGDDPPALVWVAAIPAEQGRGTRYEYSDGTWIEGWASGMWYWHGPPPPLPKHKGSWDPIR